MIQGSTLEKYLKRLNSSGYIRSKMMMNKAIMELKSAEENEDIQKVAERVKAAFKMDKYNLEAATLLLEISDIDPVEGLKNIKNIVDYYEKMIEEGYNITKEDFYKHSFKEEVVEYLLAKMKYAKILMNFGMLKKAEEELIDCLKIEKEDRLEARYFLMSVYALLEEVEKAQDLYEKYKEDSLMMIPMSIAYFKDQRYVKARNLIKKSYLYNKKIEEFFTYVSIGEIEIYLEDELYLDDYLMMAEEAYEVKDLIYINPRLYLSAANYGKFAIDCIEKNKKKAKKKKK